MFIVGLGSLKELNKYQTIYYFSILSNCRSGIILWQRPISGLFDAPNQYCIGACAKGSSSSQMTVTSKTYTVF